MVHFYLVLTTTDQAGKSKFGCRTQTHLPCKQIWLRWTIHIRIGIDTPIGILCEADYASLAIGRFHWNFKFLPCLQNIFRMLMRYLCASVFASEKRKMYSIRIIDPKL